MVEKTLLSRQLDKAVGITNISLVRGYKAEKINYKGINYFENADYENNQILNSLFYAEEAINDNVIISYSDILFESSVVKRPFLTQYDISIVVDIDWQGYYQGRDDHPIDEAEKVVFDANNQVVQIGKIITEKNDVYGEFIGMLKLSAKGQKFSKTFSEQNYKYKSFKAAKSFKKHILLTLSRKWLN